MSSKNIGGWSKVIIGVYLFLAAAAFLLAVTAEDALGSIFLILVALPWGQVVTSIVDRLGINNIVLNYMLLLAGIGLNTLLFYLFARWLHRRKT